MLGRVICRQQSDLISLLLFFSGVEGKLKICIFFYFCFYRLNMIITINSNDFPSNLSLYGGAGCLKYYLSNFNVLESWHVLQSACSTKC
jgi:hypothetical protein